MFCLVIERKKAIKDFSLSNSGPEDVEMNDTKTAYWMEAFVPNLKKEANINKRLAALNHRWLETKIKKAIQPFAQGEQRIAYHGKKTDNSSRKKRSDKIVLKEFKCLEDGRDRREEYIEIMETQCTAAYLAAEFNNVSPKKQKKIQFLQVSRINNLEFQQISS